jgi:glycosyltransferase involved in cell wall biosynthesis
MRVLLVNQHFPPESRGGAELYTQSLAAELGKAGDDVSVVARSTVLAHHEIRMLRERLPGGNTIYRLIGGGAAFEYRHFLRHHERLEQLFTMAILESAPDVVHVNHLKSLSPRFIPVAHRLGAAVVVSLHDFYFACPMAHLQQPTGDVCQGPDYGRECARTCFAGRDDAWLRWGMRTMYFRKLLAMSDEIIAYSKYVVSYFQGTDSNLRPIHFIPNSVPVEFSMKEGRDGVAPGPRGTLAVAFCGTVAPHKGPHVILEALRIAALPSVRVLVLGSVPAQEYSRRLRQKAETVPGLTLCIYGAYKRSELPVLLQDADCVIVPSLVPEAGPFVPREALALGVPVVAARLGALPELIADGENGFTFDPSRPAELAAILRRMAEDEQLLARLRAGARRSPLVTADWHTQRVRLVYEDAIRDFRSRGARQDIAEFSFLHNALLQLGFDSTRPELTRIRLQGKAAV